MEIGIVLFDGFDELDAVGPHEVFGAAATEGADVSTAFTTVRRREHITARHGLRLEPDCRLEAIDPDLLVVPGGGWSGGGDTGVRAERDRGVIPDAVGDHHSRGDTVAGVCTGVLLVSDAGILAGRPAVTHRDARAELGDTDAEVVEARVVDDGDVLTAGGVTAGLDLALHVLEREFGSDIAEAVAESIEYDRRDPVYVTE